MTNPTKPAPLPRYESWADVPPAVVVHRPTNAKGKATPRTIERPWMLGIGDTGHLASMDRYATREAAQQAADWHNHDRELMSR